MARSAFQQKVVVITGGCAGIGRALALRFAQAGARLALLDIQCEALEAFRQQLQSKLNVEVLALPCDVADHQQCEQAIGHVIEHFGGIDVLINNAAITHRSAFAETELKVFERIMGVNYFGALHCTRPALDSLVQRKGQIIVMSSLSSFAPLLYRSAYNASKHALHGLFQTLRLELQDSGVNVMLVSPGYTATDIRKNALKGDGSIIQQSPAAPFKVAAAADVADAVYQGAVRRRRQLVLSNVDWRARLLARLFPRLFERWMVPRLSGIKSSR
ncbi:SDR family oxidoreductase [Halopseudomonas yangmingensis]|uniref:Short-chain dehydrogenase n=1 Tax=Halopseudomonas yangmingensis TaxID=1720063 RepID=A0A1I4PXF1_9GAMM|nr:SDR family oxidoreductase [Halopseudomonas yangmingensis]SFM32120.1 Short-chain dehydrogenase [Halopseudomonas yangmingensis]